MDFSSGSGWQSNPHLYGRRSYERHPRPDHAAHRGTRATTTGGDQVSDASDYIDPLALGPSLETMPVFPPLCFPQADPKSMTTATPHTRSMQALEAPPEDGPIYLHLPQYNGYTNHSGWSDAQTYSAPYGRQSWIPFDSSYTPLPSSMILPDLSPTGVPLPLPQEHWSFEPPLPSFTSVSVDDVQHASTSTPSSSDASSSRSVPCQWGQKCGLELDDLTAAGIARHLKEYHVQEWDNRARGRCEWHGSPCTNSTMYYASFGKHIASVHLGATARPCDKCGETFARADTLDRHMKLYCRLRSK